MIGINYPKGKPSEFRYNEASGKCDDPMTVIDLPKMSIATAIPFADCPPLQVKDVNDIPADYPHRKRIISEIARAVVDSEKAQESDGR